MFSVVDKAARTPRSHEKDVMPLGVTKERTVLAVISAALVAWLVSPEPLKGLVELFRN